MTPDEILEIFSGPPVRFPREAVEAAVAQRDEITPGLLRILEITLDRAEEVSEDKLAMAHFYAMLLLAQFREPRAYPLMLRMAGLPSKIIDGLLGDSITMHLGRVLASVSGGDIARIQALVEDEGVDEWVRGAGLTALVSLVAAGIRTREETIEFFGQLYRGRLKREWSHAWDALVSRSCDLYARELAADIEQAYED